MRIAPHRGMVSQVTSVFVAFSVTLVRRSAPSRQLPKPFLGFRSVTDRFSG